MCVFLLLTMAETIRTYFLTVIAFTGVLLTIVFVHLKLIDQITWHWALVFLPFWVTCLCVSVSVFFEFSWFVFKM